HLLDDGQDQVAAVAGGGDVEEGELVGALFIVAAGDFDRIAGIGQVDEVDALDHPAGRDVEAGNDAAGERRGGACALPRGALRGGGVHWVSSSARAWAAWKSSAPS